MTHASFCSGIDGPALAATWLGWDHAFYGDINEFCLTVLKYFYPNAKQYTDIRTADVRQFRRKVDVFSAGFPCQPFSVAGDRSGEDHDSYLWPETLRLVDDLRPTWFVGENVDGITSMVFSGEETVVGGQTDIFGAGNTVYEKRERYIIDRICCDLEQIGYSVQPVIIPACGVGAPHQRYRCFFIAYNVKDTHSNGWEDRERKEEPEKRRQWDAGAGDIGRICADNGETWPIAHTTSQRSQKRLEDVGRENGAESGSGLVAESERFIGERIIADTDGIKRRQRRLYPSGSIPTERHVGPCDSRADWRFWANFPTQSPVCSGTNGFPGRISGITVSRWRRESIQALGNAIVPQVIYQIYEAIDRLYKNELI